MSTTQFPYYFMDSYRGKSKGGRSLLRLDEDQGTRRTVQTEVELTDH